MAWNPDVYEKFKAERSLPFKDLQPLIVVRSGLRVIDLGCGTGELTEKLAGILSHSTVLGIDSSQEMLSRATEKAKKNLRFKLISIESVCGEWDLVFSHSALQWVNNHRELIPKLCSLLSPIGQLVIQFPSIYNHPIYLLINETALEDPFQKVLGGWSRKPDILSLEEYAEILHQSFGSNFTVFSKVYPYTLQNADDIVEWVHGTSLVPYLERLPPNLHNLFIEKYRMKLYQLWSDGPIVYFFKRVFLVGKRC